MLTPARFTRTMPSDYALLSPLADEVGAFIEAHVPDEDLAYRALLLVTEVVTNAMEHGNGLDMSKAVTLDLEIASSRIVIDVTDEGEGFDPDAVPDAVSDDDPLSEGHRGLFLIQSYADEVRFEDGGRRVIVLLNAS